MASNHNNRFPTSTPIPPSLQAKLAAFQANRAAPTNNAVRSLEDAMNGVSIAPPAVPPPPLKPGPSLAARMQALRGQSTPGRRPKPAFSLHDIDPSLGGISDAGLGAGRPRPPLSLHSAAKPPAFATPFANFSKIVDPSGALNFSGKAILHASGVNFENGSSFAINRDQLQLDDEELGRGNYGTVKKVLHKPTNVAMAMKEIRDSIQANSPAIIMELDVLHRAVAPEIVEFYGAFFIESCVYYCMEYMDAGSLDKLIQSNSQPPQPQIPKPPSSDPIQTDASSPEYSFAMPFVEEDLDLTKDENFEPYNRAFNRTCPPPIPSTYSGGPIPEAILGRIAASMVRGLKFLKDELNIIHRDVKPTNVLVNCKGQVKLCDFGVSGQLDKSMAKTNIGCQSYMAPERIRGESRVVGAVPASEGGTGTAAAAQGGVPGTAALADELYGAYTVSSDVWSLGLSIIELGLGRYPYPPETYSNVFAQLTAIVHGPPPCLPSGPPPPLSPDDDSSFEEPVLPPTLDDQDPLISPTTGRQRPGYSPFARDWVNKCMRKDAKERATYKELLEHPWLIRNGQVDVDMEGWVRCALDAKERAKAGRGR
ncbi:STE/STE7 protein kinase [Coprinopsis cinerea okayama7|uniref:mitogen-activated protein kinase kinase n=1 Tax=Coprinopsis cinerea (strain Okayama-7 / 130 / ATCC MYA-4618 / FGSC 9003) TaxID=240176 RepID=D6RLP8_COPC7|nr:STE/STE7 protein kinase [Coprinopsis cinerea okayama7\|eukprot:XP_002911710.1 STE/STE7 protein kinase [Coprinopsis cinerea okayama7\